MWTGYYTKSQLLEYLRVCGFQDYKVPGKGKKLVLRLPNYQPLNYGEVEKTEMNATTGGKLYRLTLERR